MAQHVDNGKIGSGEDGCNIVADGDRVRDVTAGVQFAEDQTGSEEDGTICDDHRLIAIADRAGCGSEADRAPVEDGRLRAGDDRVITINVGGSRHRAFVSTLLSKPGTRLSHLAAHHRQLRRDEYFYDRHPGVFNTVIDYYRCDELHVPLDVCGAVVKRELAFWRVDDRAIEPCCWISYTSFIDNEMTLAHYSAGVEREAGRLRAISSLVGWQRTRMQCWMVLDNPRYSRLAMAFAVTSFMFVLLSISGFVLETIPLMRTAVNVTRHCGGERAVVTSEVESHRLLLVVDYVCTTFFTLELIVRVVFAPDKRAFFTSLMNIIDMLALLPLYLEITLAWTDRFICMRANVTVVETILILRIVRVFRIFHLVKHYAALGILLHAIRASVQELLMLAIFLVIATVVFSTLMYYAERGGGGVGHIGTIPIGFWWSVVTITTVGYGDLTPHSTFGYVVGSLCAVSGLLLVALTVPVISNNFMLFYTHARTREKIVMKDGLRTRRASRADGDATLTVSVRRRTKTSSRLHASSTEEETHV